MKKHDLLQLSLLAEGCPSRSRQLTEWPLLLWKEPLKFLCLRGLLRVIDAYSGLYLSRLLHVSSRKYGLKPAS
jgi:hypothetical protein